MELLLTAIIVAGFFGVVGSLAMIGLFGQGYLMLAASVCMFWASVNMMKNMEGRR